MYAFAVLTNLLLLASCALAAPASQNVTTHTFEKRDAVCGADFRTLVNFNDCLPKKVAYTLTPPSTIVAKKFSVRCVRLSSGQPRFDVSALAGIMLRAQMFQTMCSVVSSQHRLL